MLRTLCEPNAAVTIDSFSSRNAGERFKIRVALRLLQIDRDNPAVLARFDFLVIPIGAFDQANGETRAACAAPIDQVPQIFFGIAQISLDDDAGVRPIEKLRFGEERPEKFERGVFVRVTFHVEVDEGAEFARAAQDGTQFAAEVRDGIGRIGRIHLRIERGDFYGNINDGKQLLALAKRISPAFGFRGEMFEQIHAARGVFGRFLFAHDRFAQKIDREPDALFRAACAAFSLRRAGFFPAMNWRAMPETFQRKTWPLIQGATLASCTPVRMSGVKPLRMSSKYSSRWRTISPPRRSEARTSTKRNICTLKCSSRMESAIMRW